MSDFTKYLVSQYDWNMFTQIKGFIIQYSFQVVITLFGY